MGSFRSRKGYSGSRVTRRGYNRGGYGKGTSARKGSGRSYSGSRRRTGGTSVLAKRQNEVARQKEVVCQKVQVRTFDQVLKYYVHPADLANQKYFAVPVTSAIPAQRLAELPLSGKHQKARMCHLTEVNVSFMVSHSHPVAISAACYPVGLRGSLLTLDVDKDGTPFRFLLGKQESGCSQRLMSIEETGFVNDQEGPFDVVPFGEDKVLMLNSTDGSMYNCQLRQGNEGPVGKVEWRVGDKSVMAKRSGMVVNQRTLGSVGGETQVVEMDFKIDKCLEFVEEESGAFVCCDPLQIMVMVSSCGALVSGCALDLVEPVVAGHVGKVVVDVHYC